MPDFFSQPFYVRKQFHFGVFFKVFIIRVRLLLFY